MLPDLFVVVIVRREPGSDVVVVKVEPRVSVVTTATGISCVYVVPLCLSVTVDGVGYVSDFCPTVMGYARRMVDPATVVVTVTVVDDTDTDGTVTVVVSGLAMLLAMPRALSRADCETGVPTRPQIICIGVKRELISMFLSHSPRIQVTRSGRKRPFDCRQMHLTSVMEQLSSVDWSMHWFTQSGKLNA